MILFISYTIEYYKYSTDKLSEPMHAMTVWRGMTTI